VSNEARIPSLGPRGEGWVIGQFILLWAIFTAAWLGGAPVGATVLFVARVLGAGIVLAGLAISLLAIRELRRSLSVLPRPVDEGSLVSSGLYGRVRHPIYSGVILAAAGASLYAVSPIAGLLTVVLAIWLDLKSRREEIWLRERYPGYAEYAGRTRRFVPGLY
jgi:protein-S-isoprenylcysteine O-methyltransferase Ste14